MNAAPELLEAAAQGDEQACEQMLRENSGLIWSIVRRYYGRGVEPDDLYQLGCLGFIKAMWCGDEACEDEIKAQTGGATSRCIPEEEEHLSDVCVCCGKPAQHMVYWGKAY